MAFKSDTLFKLFFGTVPTILYSRAVGIPTFTYIYRATTVIYVTFGNIRRSIKGGTPGQGN